MFFFGLRAAPDVGGTLGRAGASYIVQSSMDCAMISGKFMSSRFHLSVVKKRSSIIVSSLCHLVPNMGDESVEECGEMRVWRNAGR